MPRKIAEYLKLEHPDRYIGHCFRRTSATLLANAGADLSVLKRHRAWKSSSAAEKYVEGAIDGKVKIARMIQGAETFAW
jgi:integrase